MTRYTLAYSHPLLNSSAPSPQQRRWRLAYCRPGLVDRAVSTCTPRRRDISDRRLHRGYRQRQRAPALVGASSAPQQEPQSATPWPLPHNNKYLRPSEALRHLDILPSLVSCNDGSSEESYRYSSRRIFTARINAPNRVIIREDVIQDRRWPRWHHEARLAAYSAPHRCNLADAARR